MQSVRMIVCKWVRRPSPAQITRRLQTATEASTRRPSLGVAPTVSITAAIINDHRELEECYDEVVNSSDQDRRQRYGNQFTWELARHSVGEELVLYPAFERHMGSVGHQIAETDRKDHHEIKELLKEFQNMKSKDTNYVPKITELWCKLEGHIKDEEDYDLPALEEKLSPDASKSMAKSFERTKSFAPSRSHPSAGEHPPFETVMGLLTAPIDRLADLFRKFPDKAPQADIDKPAGPTSTLHD
ncbi:hypothetical protein MFIFM68171_11189 [Madurella fahalii]|uniref:Hemerythrin-like domain-containing protein n=1 Tax=Madurella fahalii TaxID=1157608 RepID=A0ABQ0GTH2_9PEZI